MFDVLALNDWRLSKDIIPKMSFLWAKKSERKLGKRQQICLSSLKETLTRLFQFDLVSIMRMRIDKNFYFYFSQHFIETVIKKFLSFLRFFWKKEKFCLHFNLSKQYNFYLKNFSIIIFFQFSITNLSF